MTPPLATWLASSSALPLMVSAPRLLLCFLVLFPFLSNISLSARSGGSRGAPPRHDASLLLHPTSISLSHSQSISPLPPHNLTLQPSHLCATCHLVIHEFLRFIISSFDQEQFDGVLEASALASLFCEGQPFSHMQPTYTAACQELILELGRGKPDPTDPSVNVTLEELFAPLIGERTVRHYVEFPQRDFILYKRRACQRAADCPASHDPIGPLPTHRSSECAECDGAALLLANALSREADIDAAGSVEYVMDNACREVGFWWEKPAGVEAACVELLEDPDWAKVVEKAVRREGRHLRDQGRPLEAVHALLRQELCVKTTLHCPPELKRSGGKTNKDEL